MASEKDPVKVAEGGYGCVFRPALKCHKERTTKKGYVSKAMSEKNATSELAEYENIDDVDPKHKYHLEAPKKCKLAQTPVNLKSIKQCKVLDKVSQLDVALLQLKDGGVSLKDFANSNPTRIEMENFLVDFYNVVLGIDALCNQGYRHIDLKPHNIIYNPKQRLMLLIDFGLMLSDFDMSSYYEGKPISHWNYPPEVYLLRMHNFKKSGWPMHNMSELLKFQAENGTQQVIEYLKMDAAESAKYIKDFETDINRYSNPDDIAELSWDKHDVFGTGLSLLYVLRKNKSKLDVRTYNVFEDLGFEMMHGAPSKRLTTEDCKNTFELALESTGLLKSQHKKIVDGSIVERNSSRKSETQRIMSRISRIPSISAAKLEKITTENPPDAVLHKPCPDDREMVGKRCLKKCGDGKVRNPDTNRCRNVVQTRRPKNAECEDGKERNPETGRCVKKCGPGQVRSAKTRRCVKNLHQ